jgi:hypothetical protein
MMVKANKRLPASVSVSKSAIESVTSTLEGLPEKPKENWSLREAVSVLQESISAALRKGYSYEEVAKMLSEKGVGISASSLKSYLSAAKRQKGASSTKARRTGRRTKTVQTGDVSMNGAATASALINSKAALNELNGNSDATVELPAQKPTRRKSQTSARKTAAKTKPAAKTSTKRVSQTKAAAKSTGRKKSS